MDRDEARHFLDEAPYHVEGELELGECALVGVEGPRLGVTLLLAPGQAGI